MRPQTRRILSVATLSLATVLAPLAGLGGAAVASKGPSVIKVEKPIEGGFFYGNDDFQAFAGPPIDAASCAFEDDPTVIKSYRQRRDGTWTERWRDRLPVTLYETDVPAPIFLEQQCEAISEGADPPEPFASGRGKVRSFVSGLTSPDGPPSPGTRIVNRTFGIVTGDDSVYLVKARADLVLDNDLEPIGDPADFQSLTVKRIGACGPGGR